MSTQEIDRIECAIRHIQTAVDVDPWAVEIAVEAMERMASANLQPNLQPTCNLASNDTIIRQAAIDAVETKIKKWNAVDGEGYHVGLGLRYTDAMPPFLPFSRAFFALSPSFPYLCGIRFCSFIHPHLLANRKAAHIDDLSAIMGKG